MRVFVKVLVAGVYYCFNIGLIVLAVILSTFVVNVSEGLIRVPECGLRVSRH